jgi:hypothetical protein
MGERVFHVLRLSLLGWSPVPSGHVTEFPRSTHPVGVVGAIDDVNIPDLLTEGCPSGPCCNFFEKKYRTSVSKENIYFHCAFRF